MTHPKLLDAKRYLAQQSSFYIMKADKGSTIVLWDSTDYKKEALRQLQGKHYKLVSEKVS